MHITLFFFSCIILGLLTGFLSGLLGIGGGLVIVPVLRYILPLAGIAADDVLLVSLGTSLTTIIMTTGFSSRKHYKAQNINFSIAKRYIPFVVIGAICGSFIVTNLPKNIILLIFALVIALLAYRMIFTTPVIKEVKHIRTAKLGIFGYFIGMFSTFAGIGGGAFNVPFYSEVAGLEMKQSIGTSSFTSFCMSIVSASLFILLAKNAVHMPRFSLG